MKIESRCSRCATTVTAVVQMPTAWTAVRSAIFAAHRTASPSCPKAGFSDAHLTLGAEDRPSAVFNICRHAGDAREGKPCGCYLRCGCGWLVAKGGECTNPNHTRMAASV